MSGIQLSDALISDVKTVLQKYDQSAGDDMIAVQYMAASIGYFMSAIPEGQFDKKTVLGQLADFSVQVFEQMENDKQPQQEAFGVWKPGD